MGKIVKDDKIQLWQSNFITSARYEMTALEKNILYMLMSQIKKTDSAETIYTISGQELMQSTGKEVRYEDLKSATKKLLERVVDGMNGQGNYVQTTFLSSATYITGKGLIELTLSPAIRPHYIELKEKFTTFQLEVALSLRSVYSKRMYEILSMYKNFKDKKFRMSVSDLKHRLSIISDKGVDKYKSFKDFNKAILIPAENEINGESDLFFTYKPIEGKQSGRGRKPIDFIEFDIVYKGKDAPTIGYDEDNKPLFDRLISDFSLRKDQANDIIIKYSKVEINKQLYDIHIANMNGKIANLGAYTAKIFNL